jgi:hypothetical protein
MSTLSSLISKRRISGQGVVSSLGGSLKDRLKEKIDPRRLFNQNGVMTSLFPGLKSYNASTSFSPKENVINDPILQDISKSMTVLAKKTSVLKELSRDARNMSTNLKKFINMLGKQKAAESVDAFFLKSDEREKLYENTKLDPMSNSPERQSKQKKKLGGLMGTLLTVGLAGVGYLTYDFLMNGGNSIVAKTYEKIKNKFIQLKIEFMDYVMNTVTPNMEKLWSDISKLSEDSLNDIVDRLLDGLSIGNILKSLDSDESSIDSMMKEIEKSTNNYKNKMSESINNFSFFPEAKASTLPSALRSKSQQDFRQTGVEDIDASTNTQLPSLQQKLLKRESGGNYRVINTIGYVGGYQFGAAALETLGYIKTGASKQGNRVLKDSSVWTGKNGAKSLDDFLSSRYIQDTAFQENVRFNERVLKDIGVINNKTTEKQKSGLLAVAHLQGAGGARDFSRGINKADAYGTKSSEYFKLGSSATSINEMSSSIITNENIPTTKVKTVIVATNRENNTTIIKNNNSVIQQDYTKSLIGNNS